MKRYFANVLIGPAFAATVLAHVAPMEAQAACLPNESVDPASLSLPQEIEIEKGHVIRSAELSHGCEVDLHARPITQTPTGSRKVLIATVPEAYAGLDDAGLVNQCGNLVDIRDKLNVPRSVPRLYISRSDPDYTIHVTSYTGEMLELGRVFLSAHTQADCMDLFKEYASEMIGRSVVGIAPRYFD